MPVLFSKYKYSYTSTWSVSHQKLLNGWLSLIVKGRDTVLLLGESYRTSSSPRVALEVNMILNPLYFSSVCVCTLTCLPSCDTFPANHETCKKKKKVTPENLSWVINENSWDILNLEYDVENKVQTQLFCSSEVSLKSFSQYLC